MKDAAIFLFSLLVISAPLRASVETTASDRKSLDLTLYSDNFALVREVRQIKPGQGEQSVRFLDVPRFITPESIQVRSLTSPSEFKILEQNYLGRTLSASTLLDQYVGKKIKVQNWNEFQDRKEVLDAVLLSNDGEPVYQIGGEVYIGYPGVKILPELPSEMLAKPAFVWQVESKTRKAQDVEVIYLTSNLGWKTDYVLTLQEQGNSADFAAWVGVTNESGSAFKNASLRLMAGQVNRPPQYQESAPKAMLARMSMAGAADTGGFQEQGAFEYHAYDLARKVELRNGETKQLPLFPAKTLKVSREYLIEGTPYLYRAVPGTSETKVPVRIILKFKNDADSGAGVPLPQGTVRMYSRDGGAKAVYLGEDGIGHTASGEEVRLQAGTAFDLTALRTQIDFKQISANMTESEWEIRLKNAKQEEVVLEIVETLQGNWEIISNSHDYRKKNASSIAFSVKVGRGSETVVKYKVRTGF